MKHTYSFRLLWCLLWLTISPMAQIHAQNTGSTISRNIVLETEGSIIPIIATDEGGVGLLTVGAPGQPIILNKINADGRVVWRKNITRFGDATYGAERRVIQTISTSDSGFVLIGTYRKPAISSFNFSVVVKFDANGDQAWYKEVLIDLGPVSDIPAQIIETRDGGYLMTIDGNMPKILAGIGVMKLDISGNVLFTRYYDIPLGNSLAMATVRGVVEMSPGYALVGSYLPNYSTSRTFEEGAMFQLIDNNGNLIRSKGFYSSDREFTDVRYDPLDNALLLKTTPNSSAAEKEVIKTDLDGNVLFRYKLENSTESFLTTAKINIAPYPQDGYIITDTKNETDFRLTHLNRSGAVVTSQTFGGSGRELLYDVRILKGDKIFLTGLTNSRDGDLANRTPSPFDGRVWMLTLNFPSFSTPSTTPPSPTPSGLVLTQPAYDCNTGQLTLNTSGGNGAPIEFRIIGNRDWSASSTFTIPAHQRQGTTFTLDARQSGQVISIGFTSVCGTSTTPQPPNPPTTPSGFVLQTPNFNCATGLLSAAFSNGNGGPVEYRIVGNRDWNSSNEFVIPPWQRNGTTFTIDGRLNNGATSSIQFTTNCGAARTANAETMAIPQLNAQLLPNPVTGNELVVEVTGANGQAVDFALSDLSGKVLNIQRAEAVSDRHRQTMAVGNLIEGVYLLRVSTATQHKTLKVLKR